MAFNALSAAKFIASGIVGIGTGKIVGRIIKNNVSPETLIDKVTVTAAAWVIGGIATERTKKYSDDMIDDVVKTSTRVYGKFKLDNKLGRINRFESTFEKEGLDPKDFRRNDKDKWEKIEVENAEVVETVSGENKHEDGEGEQQAAS